MNGHAVLTHENSENDENGLHGNSVTRHVHPDGEVTCVSTEQYVSLPALARVG